LDLSFGVSSFISRTTSDSGTSASGTGIRCTISSISCIQEVCVVFGGKVCVATSRASLTRWRRSSVLRHHVTMLVDFVVLFNM
jgi:hypothetical protein